MKNSSAVQKTFGSRDLRRKIMSYGGKTCKDLTDDYKGCVQPFRYRNAQTGQLKLCYKECYDNLAVWLEPLLANRPTSYVIKVAAEHGKARKVTGEIKYGKKLAISAGEQPGIVEVGWVDAAADYYYYGSMHYAKSVKDGALKAQDIMRERNATMLNIRILHNMIGNQNPDDTLSFPGNPTWNRLAPYIRFGELKLILVHIVAAKQNKTEI